MKALVLTGAAIISLGFASVFVPIPRGAREVLDVGNVSTGEDSRREQKVASIPMSAALILGGFGVAVAGKLKRAVRLRLDDPGSKADPSGTVWK